jgi:hypothetical protein
MKHPTFMVLSAMSGDARALVRAAAYGARRARVPAYARAQHDPHDLRGRVRPVNMLTTRDLLRAALKRAARAAQGR